MMKNKLLNLLQNNAALNQPIRSEDNGEEANIYLYSAIGDWFGEVSAQDFVAELAKIKAKIVHLRINSPGGDVFDARTIATTIRQSDKYITAHVDGLAASAATYIATACNSVEMAEGSFFMIHKAWTLAVGNVDEMLSCAELLEKIDGTIVNDFAKKTGVDSETIAAWMKKESWFTAEESLEHGFVDSIYTGEEVENKWNLDVYDNVPERVINNVAEKKEVVYNRDILEKRLQLAGVF